MGCQPSIRVRNHGPKCPFTGKPYSGLVKFILKWMAYSDTSSDARMRHILYLMCKLYTDLDVVPCWILHLQLLVRSI